LYRLNAADADPLINNKVFFNTPNVDMPTGAITTDIFNGNTHNIWLYNEPTTADEVIISDFSFIGTPNIECGENVMAFGDGGYFYFNSSVAGTANLLLDLNNNGVFTDAVDRTIFDFVDAGQDSIFWDGNDGLGVPLPEQTALNVAYNLSIRGGEIHIPLIDIENNAGGVNFTILNGGPTATSSFYYDHSDVNGGVSGGGTPGNPQPTTTLDTYSGGFGNNKILDYWSFQEFNGGGVGTLVIDVVDECNVCDENTIPNATTLGAGTYCQGTTFQLSANNTTAGIGALDYVWTGPSGQIEAGQVAVDGTTAITITDAQVGASGIYTIAFTSADDCTSLDTVMVTVSETPAINTINGGGTYCVGTEVVLSSFNPNIGTNPSTYTANWLLPDGSTEVQVLSDTSAFELTIASLDMSNDGTYQLFITNADGCVSDTLEVNVEIAITPEITETSGDDNVCVGQDYTLSISQTNLGSDAYSITWLTPQGDMTTSIVSGAQAFLEILDFSNEDAGTYEVFITSNLGCNSQTEMITLGITNSLDFTAVTATGVQCNGGALTLMTNYSGTDTNVIYDYTWTLPDGSTSEGSATGNEVVTLTIDNLSTANNGEVIFAYQLDATCGESLAPYVIDVQQLMIQGVADELDFCEGADATIFAQTNDIGVSGLIYTWLLPTGGQLTDTIMTSTGPLSLDIEEITQADAGNYGLLVTSLEGCNATPTQVTVDVNPTPMVIDLDILNSYCEGQDITINATHNGTAGVDWTYTWTDFNGVATTGAINSDAPIEIVIADAMTNQSGTYTLVIQDNVTGCAGDINENTVNIIPGPEVINLINDPIVCDGEEATLIAMNQVLGITTIDYEWIGPDGLSLGTGTVGGSDPITLDLGAITAANAGTYMINMIADGGCQISFSEELVIAPELDLTDLLPAFEEVCVGNEITLSVNNLNANVVGMNYTWALPSGMTEVGTVAGNEAIELVIPLIHPDDDGIYGLSVTTDEGCGPVILQKELFVTPIPELENITESGTYCVGDPLVLNANNYLPTTGTMTYTWTGPNGTSFSNDIDWDGEMIWDLGTADEAESGTYTLAVTSFSGCIVQEVTVDINVLQVPVLENITGTATYCLGDQITLSATNSTPNIDEVVFTWTAPDGTVVATGTGNGTGPYTASFPAEVGVQSGIYTLSVVNGGECAADLAQVDVQLVIFDLPALSANTLDVCEGADLVLTTEEYDGVVEYTWWFDDDAGNETIAVTTEPMLTVENPEAGTYFVVATVNGCDAGSEPVMVGINIIPTAVDDNYTTIVNQSLQELVITNDDVTGVVNWDVSVTAVPSNGTIVMNNDGTFIYTPNEGFTGEDVFAYLLCNVDCPNQCMMALVTITVEDEECFIPNFFTPNEDGSNDVFYIGCLENKFPEANLQIFNRWGDKVYTAEPYDNNWNGQFDGKDLPAGTYFYLLRLRPGDEQCEQGYITIIR